MILVFVIQTDRLCMVVGTFERLGSEIAEMHPTISVKYCAISCRARAQVARK